MNWFVLGMMVSRERFFCWVNVIMLFMAVQVAVHVHILDVLCKELACAGG